MRRKCSLCNGKGKEPCEIHGEHKCKACNGTGCVTEEVFQLKGTGIYK